MKFKGLVLLIFMVLMCTFACKEKDSLYSEAGEKIYKQNCVLCHGKDGKLGANGSKDLTVSKMTLEERVVIIKNGKGAMVGLGTLLSEEEIKAVAKYSMTL